MASPPKWPLQDLDEAALQRARQGQLRQWLSDYAPALRRYFTKKVSAAEADDLVQEVFLALQARGAASDIENVAGYIFRTAANVLIRRRRRATWDWDRHSQLEEIENLSDGGLSPERVLIAREEIDAAVEVLNALPPRTAQAFFLHRFDELTYEAVGRRLGISAKGAQYLVRRAVQRLSERLEGLS